MTTFRGVSSGTILVTLLAACAPRGSAEVSGVRETCRETPDIQVRSAGLAEPLACALVQVAIAALDTSSVAAAVPLPLERVEAGVHLIHHLLTRDDGTSRALGHGYQVVLYGDGNPGHRLSVDLALDGSVSGIRVDTPVP